MAQIWDKIFLRKSFFFWILPNIIGYLKSRNGFYSVPCVFSYLDLCCSRLVCLTTGKPGERWISCCVFLYLWIGVFVYLCFCVYLYLWYSRLVWPHGPGARWKEELCNSSISPALVYHQCHRYLHIVSAWNTFKECNQNIPLANIALYCTIGIPFVLEYWHFGILVFSISEATRGQ